MMKVQYLPKGTGKAPTKGYIQRFVMGVASDIIEFDALVTETHQHAANVTSHPVEKGVQVSDFTRPEPVSLKIDGLVTNHPITLPRSQTDGSQVYKKSIKWQGDRTLNVPLIGGFNAGTGLVGMIGGAIAGKAALNERTVVANTYTTEMFRVEAVYEILADILSKGETITIYTTLAQYDDMVISSLSVNRNVSLGNSLQFSLEAKQIRIVETKTVQAISSNIATKKVKKGTQQTKTPTEPTQVKAEEKVSVAAGLFL